MNKDQTVVLSASRRTDLVACYPEYLIEKLKEHPPEGVHTIVIWTKNPQNMIVQGPLRKVLAGYRQIYLHLTITGLGGSLLEPHIPPWRQTAAMIPALVELLGDQRRLSWRFDPIVRADTGGNTIDNYPLFSEISRCMSLHGITTCRTSWVQPYRKVTRRLAKKGISLNLHTEKEKKAQAAELERTAVACNITVLFCSAEGFQRSRCIDGQLLSALHPDGLSCSVKKAKGQRTLCGCTESIDIGWYSLKCPNGCLYCYAEPLVEEDTTDGRGKKN